MTLSNREQWLANLAIAVRPHIASTIAGGGDEESAIRLSCGFPPKTGRKAVGASIVPPTASADFTAEIFVSPTVDDASAVARLVLPRLLSLLRLCLHGASQSLPISAHTLMPKSS
jgi:hypothetical protein